MTPFNLAYHVQCKNTQYKATLLVIQKTHFH